MSYDPYDFEAFINRIKDEDYHEIVKEAEREANIVEDSSYRVRGAVHRRQQGSMVYVDQIGAFLFWMHNGMRPAGASEEDFQLYRIVAEKLVEKGQFKPTVLEMFKRRS